MDPDETLTELRDLAAKIDTFEDEESLLAIATRQAELFTALDDWISRSGFLPRAWRTPSYTRNNPEGDR